MSKFFSFRIRNFTTHLNKNRNLFPLSPEFDKVYKLSIGIIAVIQYLFL